jgi:hypothetical protein
MSARATLTLLVAIACIYGTGLASVEAQSRGVKSHTNTKLTCKPAWLQLEKYDTYTGVVSTWHHSVVHGRLKSTSVHIYVAT